MKKCSKKLLTSRENLFPFKVYTKASTKPSFLTKLQTQGWKFNGTVDELNLKVFCIEENIVFDDFIKVRVTFPLMHEYPLLFDSWDNG